MNDEKYNYEDWIKQAQKIVKNSTYGSGSIHLNDEVDDINDLLDTVNIPKTNSGGRKLSTLGRVEHMVNLIKELKLDNIDKLKNKL